MGYRLKIVRFERDLSDLLTHTHFIDDETKSEKGRMA